MAKPDLTKKSEMGNDAGSIQRPGRPKAIPEALVPKILLMYHHWGLGYRAIARELLADGLCVDWSTVRRVVKSHHQSDTPGQTCPPADL